MAWGKFWMIGDFGQQLRSESFRHDLRQRRKDNDQDEQIESLRRENRELKLYLAGLLKLLVNKGTVTQEELTELVRLVDEAEKEAQAGGPDDATSPDLEALAAAAKQFKGD